ncbi:MAG: hypothetical protein ACJA1U_002714 [Bermanella sp.]|jgi:hypothetical protein
MVAPNDKKSALAPRILALLQSKDKKYTEGRLWLSTTLS